MATLAEELTVTRRKDFIRENILRAKHSHPAEPRQRSVDTRRGDTHDLKNSGLLPIYVHKKIYGKVPKCVRIAARADVETGKKRDDVEDEKLCLCRKIGEEERQALLDDMKKKWDELMQQYRMLPFLTDTLPKAQRKAKIERALNQLEKDIETIERHRNIYIYDDD